MKHIVLASASPRRAELLANLGVEFDKVVPDLDERIPHGMAPGEAAEYLSRKKAADVCRRINRNAVVIAADTIVFKDRVLGKPADSGEAFRMLEFLQGGWHTVITGYAVVDTYGERDFISGYESTRVKMREMDDDCIKAYIATGEPFDKAGGYGIQKYGALLVERIDGCYFNVVGLPLMKLGKALSAVGVDLMG